MKTQFKSILYLMTFTMILSFNLNLKAQDSFGSGTLTPITNDGDTPSEDKEKTPQVMPPEEPTTTSSDPSDEDEESTSTSSLSDLINSFSDIINELLTDDELTKEKLKEPIQKLTNIIVDLFSNMFKNILNSFKISSSKTGSTTEETDKDDEKKDGNKKDDDEKKDGDKKDDEKKDENKPAFTTPPLPNPPTPPKDIVPTSPKPPVPPLPTTSNKDSSGDKTGKTTTTEPTNQDPPKVISPRPIVTSPSPVVTSPSPTNTQTTNTKNNNIRTIINTSPTDSSISINNKEETKKNIKAKVTELEKSIKNVDTNKPLESVKQILDIFKSLNNEDLNSFIQQFDKVINETLQAKSNVTESKTVIPGETLPILQPKDGQSSEKPLTIEEKQKIISEAITNAFTQAMQKAIESFNSIEGNSGTSTNTGSSSSNNTGSGTNTASGSSYGSGNDENTSSNTNTGASNISSSNTEANTNNQTQAQTNSSPPPVLSAKTNTQSDIPSTTVNTPIKTHDGFDIIDVDPTKLPAHSIKGLTEEEAKEVKYAIAYKVIKESIIAQEVIVDNKIKYKVLFNLTNDCPDCIVKKISDKNQIYLEKPDGTFYTNENGQRIVFPDSKHFTQTNDECYVKVIGKKDLVVKALDLSIEECRKLHQNPGSVPQKDSIGNNPELIEELTKKVSN